MHVVLSKFQIYPTISATSTSKVILGVQPSYSLAFVAAKRGIDFGGADVARINGDDTFTVWVKAH